VDAVAEHLATLAVMPEGRRPPSRLMDDASSAMVGALEPQAGTSPRSALSLIDDREIVHACVDYAVAIGRLPSLAELCIAARVSERRLRAAFVRLYDLAPSAFFRAWALTEAHRRLASAQQPAGSVTEVALDLGFGHLGRFARRYRQVHGEWPSATLRSRGLASAVSVG
jgi:AraC family ethanolamine operon transcriptional activator